MVRLREAIADVQRRLGLNRPLLARAQRRFQARRKDAWKHHQKGKRLDARADELRAEGRKNAALNVEKRAAKAHRRAYRQHRKAQWWLGRIKVLQQRVHRLEKRLDQLEADLKRESKVKFDIKANRATGGNDKARFRQTALLSSRRCESGKRRNFYSQPGRYSVEYCLTGEPTDYRSDCSQWLTSVCRTAGLPDPNGADWGWGYTGTLVGQHNGWRLASVAEMRNRGWGFVVYGSGVGYHVEAYVGPGDLTIGHGNAAIDAGVIDLFGRGDYRCYIYDPS